MTRDYITEYYDYKAYEEDFNKIIQSSVSTNLKVGKLAYYMVTKFPKLPYFWGGGHNLTKEELLGLNKKWGIPQMITDYGSDNFIVGKYYPYSFDCSGFVTWCLVNCGYNLEKYIANVNHDYSLNSQDFLQIGPIYKLNDADIITKIKIGDLAYQKHHIAIICDIDHQKEIIEVAHISYSGGGSSLTTINLITGHVVNDSEVKDRIGHAYFTDIISISY